MSADCMAFFSKTSEVEQLKTKLHFLPPTASFPSIVTATMITSIFALIIA